MGMEGLMLSGRLPGKAFGDIQQRPDKKRIVAELVWAAWLLMDLDIAHNPHGEKASIDPGDCVVSVQRANPTGVGSNSFALRPVSKSMGRSILQTSAEWKRFV